MSISTRTAAAGTRMPVLVLSLLATAVFAAITTEVLPVGLLPVIGRDLHTSESRVGLLVSAYAVVVALGSVPLMALVARWPRRRSLCVLLAGYAVSNVIMAATDSYWIALAARLLGGLAHAGFFSAVFAAAISIAPKDRTGRAVAFVGAGIALGFALGVPLGTAVGTAIGWRWAFAGCALVMLALAAVVADTLPAGQPAPAASGQVPILRAVRGRALLVVALIIVILELGHYTPYTYVSPLLLHSGTGIDWVSPVLFGYGAAGILGVLLAGVVVDRHPRAGLRVAVALTVVCLAALGLVHGAVPTGLVVIVWGVAFGAQPTLIQAVALRAAPDAPDAAPALVNATVNVGIAGGALIGARELLVAAPPALAVTGAVLAAAALLLLSRRMIASD